jgi:hypothetical protein
MVLDVVDMAEVVWDVEGTSANKRSEREEEGGWG